MTASRQWNNIQARKWAGFGHDTDQEPQEGDLSIFCAPCPQPGINLPVGWKAEQISKILSLLFFSTLF